MNKFKDITVLHIESSDHTAEALSPAVEREIDTADIVIDGGEVVKNRVNQVETPGVKTELTTFKGLILEPETAFRQIAALIEAGLIISVTNTNDKSDLSDCVFILARQYAEAAHDYALKIRGAAATETQLAPAEVMLNIDMSTIGKRIMEARVKRRMYTEELENAIHAPEGSVFRWETGKAIPSSQYIDILARVLNVSVTWLLTGKEIAKES
ncbi:XRE family transcriptional regulator [Salmonella enterica subsp. houtenae]|nr:XRE family transcriptional regulator [Salmonella enterica subsp. enterica serovar Saintpaul]ECH9933650.1 XRE family transcriptional regulator [Salmonella enterica subsp. houtenae]EGQ2095457.1 helix-turn-helix transcriptional regulator [Salmonella enterica]EDW3818819.1 helix-turn-helix transcriptional regulator [Salmonella enterica subsp. houtenae]EKF1128807.1 helix-turn-helix transcriptional regulator [Salmonella enterica]